MNVVEFFIASLLLWLIVAPTLWMLGISVPLPFSFFGCMVFWFTLVEGLHLTHWVYNRVSAAAAKATSD